MVSIITASTGTISFFIASPFGFVLFKKYVPIYSMVNYYQNVRNVFTMFKENSLIPEVAYCGCRIRLYQSVDSGGVGKTNFVFDWLLSPIAIQGPILLH